VLLGASSAMAKWIRVPYEGVRPAGMGNAYVALADDKNALWYNPAGLTQVQGVNFDLYDLVVGFDSLDTVNRLKGALLQGNSADALRADKQFARFGFFPTYTSRYFGAGIYYNLQSFLEIENFELPEVDLYGASDLAFISGFSVPLSDRVSVGASLRLIQRTGLDVTKGSNAFLEDLATTQTTFAGAVYDTLKGLSGKGWAVGATIGLQAVLPLKRKGSRWQLGAAIEDLGQTSFRGMDGLGPPPPIRSAYNFGIAYIHAFSPVSQLTVAADGRNINEPVNPIKMFHLGGEWKFRGFSFRAGANQGYLTLGLGFENSVLRANFVTTATELGDRAYERFHRWYLLQIAMGLYNEKNKKRGP